MNLNFKKGIIDYIHKDSKSGTIIYPRTLASAVYDKNGEPISNKLNTGMYKESDTEDNMVTFESGDSLSFDSWTDVDILESGESHKSIFNKLSTMVKNVRYLYKILGNTDISSINNGTVTGALNLLTSETSTLKKSVAEGKAAIANALSAQGQSTAVDAAFATLASNVTVMGNARYNSGYNQGAYDADARENPYSINYQSGYNAGVLAADGRSLPGSVNYQSGYDSGYSVAITNSGNAIKHIQIQGVTNPNFGIGFTAAYKISDTSGLYPTVGDTPVYPTSDFSVIAGEKEFGIANGKHVWIVLVVWSGQSLNYNGWTKAATWTV